MGAIDVIGDMRADLMLNRICNGKGHICLHSTIPHKTSCSRLLHSDLAFPGKPLALIGLRATKNSRLLKSTAVNSGQIDTITVGYELALYPSNSAIRIDNLLIDCSLEFGIVRTDANSDGIAIRVHGFGTKPSRVGIVDGIITDICIQIDVIFVADWVGLQVSCLSWRGGNDR